MKARAVLLLTLALTISGCRLAANIHVVDPGKLYRSAQLEHDELSQMIESAGVRSIINLRGANPGEDWYDDELANAKAHGVPLVSIPMSAGRIPRRADLLALLDAFENLPRPILVHCQAGADRTGEAAAIWEIEYMGKTNEEALEMLSVKFLHLSFATPAKDYFIREVYRGKDWARTQYDPCAQSYQYFDQPSLCSGAQVQASPDES